MKACFYLLYGLGALLLISFAPTLPVQDPWKAPAEADTLRNPFPANPQVMREGEQLYNTYCLSCHGKTGLGDGSPGKFKIEPANFHSPKVTSQTDGALFWKLTNGRGIMPAYAHALSDEKRWQLVTYIRQLPNVYKNTAKSTGAPLPLGSYVLETSMKSIYFPLPPKITNVTVTEKLLFMVDTVFTGLSRPWSMAFLPDSTILVAERGGRLLQINNGRGQTVMGNIPKGLRDVKLHPQFEQNKLIYLSYYQDPVKPEGGYSVLMRGRFEGGELVDKQILYKAGPFRGNGEWYGSKIVFDKAGYLFFTVGIKGPRKNAQDLSVIDGKILRFKDDGSVPPDNPFVKVPGTLPEIFSFGHRMPEGLARDPESGEILSTEFGELGGDELNVIKKGANYGWPLVSHSLEYNGSIISESPYADGIEAPLHHFAIAPSDLDVVYGERYPSWNRNILIGGLASKMVYRLSWTDRVLTTEEMLLQNIGRVRDVKFAPDGFLYVMTEDNGLIVRLIPVKKKQTGGK